jgi:hypothetical protein
MHIAAQQPFYLPDFYYFYKISCCDFFLIADHLRFRKQSPMVRTQLPDGKYLIVPVSHQNSPAHPVIQKVRLISDSRWKMNHLRTIRSLFQKLPYFEHYFPELEEIYNRDHQYLSPFLTEIIHWHAFHLGLQDKLNFASGLNITSQVELKKWLNRQEKPLWLIHPVEVEYYRREFPDIPLRATKPPEEEPYPEGYHPRLPMLLLFFLRGPEARMYLNRSD